MTDTEALDAISAILSRTGDWTPDTIERIAEVVAQTNRPAYTDDVVGVDG